jgi:pyridoxine 4-dehydrogenase
MTSLLDYDKFMAHRFASPLHDKLSHAAAGAPDSTAFTSARWEPSISTMDSGSPKIADKGDMQELPINHGDMPVAMSAIGVALLTLVAALGVRIRRQRGIQPVTALPSSGMQVSDMSMTLAPASNTNILELKVQGSFVKEQEESLQQISHSVLCQDKSRSRGWLQSSSQNTSSLTACYAVPDAETAVIHTVDSAEANGRQMSISTDPAVRVRELEEEMRAMSRRQEEMAAMIRDLKQETERLKEEKVVSVQSEPNKEEKEQIDAKITAAIAGDRAMVGSLDVPRIGLGTIAWNADNDYDYERIEKIASYAVDRGLNFFDTAERYGAKGTDLIPASLAAVGLPVTIDPNARDIQAYLGGDTETKLQQWITRKCDDHEPGECGPGECGVVATKFAPTPWRNSAEDVVEACRGSAERLGVESVALMQIHFPNIIQPFKKLGITSGSDEALWDGLVKVYKMGLAKNVGVSNYGPTLLRRCHEYLAERGVPLASNQIHFNLLYRRQGALKTVETCNELGVQALAYYPLAMGLLTGKLTATHLRDKIFRSKTLENRLTDTRSKELLRYLEGGRPLGFEFPGTAGTIPEGGVGPLLEVLQEVAARIGKTPAQVSLNWIICKGAIPLPGATSIQHIQDNVGALGWRLDPEDVAKLDAAADSLDWEFRGSGFQTADSKFVGYGFETWKLD